MGAKAKYKVHAWVNKTVSYDVTVLAESPEEAEALAGDAVERWNEDKIEEKDVCYNDWGLGSVKKID